MSAGDLTGFLGARYAEDWGAARDQELACGLNESRATRDINAKRAILAAYETNDSDVPLHLSSDTRKHGEWDGLRLAVRHLAAVYSDHPDYRAEWKP